MNQMKDYDNRTWERLFDFAFSDEGLSREQTQAELRRLGIDMRPTIQKIQVSIREARDARHAKAGLKRAREERSSLLTKFMSLKTPSMPDMREALERLIRDRLTGPMQAAYFHKLKNAATDEDLKGLLEDASLLEKLREDDDGGE